jgi:hypothetical protein
VQLTALSSVTRRWTGPDSLRTVPSGSWLPSANSNWTSTTTVCKLPLYPSCLLSYVYSLGLLTDVIRISDYITSRCRIICEQLLTNGEQGSSCNLLSTSTTLTWWNKQYKRNLWENITGYILVLIWASPRYTSDAVMLGTSSPLRKFYKEMFRFFCRKLHSFNHRTNFTNIVAIPIYVSTYN